MIRRYWRFSLLRHPGMVSLALKHKGHEPSDLPLASLFVEKHAEPDSGFRVVVRLRDFRAFVTFDWTWS